MTPAAVFWVPSLRVPVRRILSQCGLASDGPRLGTCLVSQCAASIDVIRRSTGFSGTDDRHAGRCVTRPAVVDRDRPGVRLVRTDYWVDDWRRRQV